MKRNSLKLSIGLASLCLFYAVAYSQTAAGQELKKEVAKSQREQDKARERLKAQGVSEADIRAAKQGFQPHPEPSPNKGPKPLQKGRTPSAKISLNDQPGVSTPKRSRDLDESSLPSNRSTGQQALDNRRSDENTKGEHALGTEKHETHHLHHHHHRPPDSCDNAGSPSDVQNCKKARDELRRPKQK